MNPMFLTAPLIIGLIIFELIYSNIIGHKNIYKLKGFKASTFMGFGTLFITSIIKFAYPAVIFYKLIYYIWLPILGFQPEMIFACLTIEAVWQFVLHTTYIQNISFLENLLIAPKQHQIHHAKNFEYLDINHGVIHAPNSYYPFTILIFGYKALWKDVKKLKNFKEAFNYVIVSPEWGPVREGTKVNTKQLISLK